MSTFNVELKRVVDDTYDIEIGYDLSSKLVSDIDAGLVGNIRKFAVPRVLRAANKIGVFE